MEDLKGKKIVVLGVANERSIGWGIVQGLKQRGAELALTYVNAAIESRVRPLAEEIGCKVVLPCDVQNDGEIEALFKSLSLEWGGVDGIVHSVAFAEKEDLTKPFSQTSRQGFRIALDVSAFSLVAVVGKAIPYLSSGAAIITLTYLGSQRVVQNYNVMGVAKAALETSVRYLAAELGEKNIRINAISAGPIKTLAASGIPHFRDMLNAFAIKAPLKRNVSLEDVAGAALFYLSSVSSGITGEITYVDCGYNILGF